VCRGCAVRRPYQLFAIGRKHRESVEIAFGGNLLKTGSVGVDQKQMEIISFGGLVIARKNDFFTIGRKKRSPVGFSQVGDLAEVAAICITNADLHIGRHYQVLG